MHFYDDSGRLTLRRLWVCLNAFIQGQHPRSLVRARLHGLEEGTPFTRGEELSANLVELLQVNNNITAGKARKIQKVPRPGEDREAAPGQMSPVDRHFLDSFLPPEDN